MSEELESSLHLVSKPDEDFCESKLIEQIMRLSPKYRNVLILKYVHNFDYAEIAKSLGITEGNARKMGQRAKNMLKKYCTECGLL